MSSTSASSASTNPPASNPTQPVLVVGATGFLGGQVVDALLARGKTVRALVRPASDATALQAKGVQVVRGDMLDPPSLEAAMTGADAAISSAVGYTRRRTGSTVDTDTAGNRNLADAARATDLRRFVFTGILASDQAPEVPHFLDKTRAENYLAELGVPHISVRPGAYLDQVMAMTPGHGPASGRIYSFGSPDVPMTWVLSVDVAAALAAAVDADADNAEHIDLGWDRPVTLRQVADLSAAQLGTPVKVRHIPWPLLNTLMGVLGKVDSRAADSRAMFAFFQTGRFVADPIRQAQLIGPVPTAENAVARWLQPQPAPQPVSS